MRIFPNNSDSKTGDRLGGLINQSANNGMDAFSQYRMERQNTVQAFLTGRHQDATTSPYDELPVVKPTRFEEVESAWRKRSLGYDGNSVLNYYDVSTDSKTGNIKLDRLSLRANLNSAKHKDLKLPRPHIGY